MTTQSSVIEPTCPCEGKTLERFIRPALLMALAQGTQHGYRIVQQLAAMPMFDGQQPNAAGVYRYLKTMAAEGLVTSEIASSEAGPAKHLYTLTPAGEQCLARWLVTLHAYREAIDGLLAVGQEIVEGWRKQA